MLKMGQQQGTRWSFLACDICQLPLEDFQADVGLFRPSTGERDRPMVIVAHRRCGTEERVKILMSGACERVSVGEVLAHVLRNLGIKPEMAERG